MPLAANKKSLNWPFRLFVLGSWTLFTLMVISISWAATAMHGRKPNIPGLFIWNLGWVLWAGETFVVIYLARRFPIERKRLALTICIQLLLSLGIAFIHLCIAYEISHTIESQFLSASNLQNSFVGTFAYTFHVYFIIYWMIVGATTAHDYYVQYRDTQFLTSQLEAKLAQAQLQSLKEQLHPHFLFNTHHSIIALMLKNETPAAIEMLTRLSDLLRMTLDRSNEQHTSLKDELDALNLYLNIQKVRYGELLEIQIDVEPQLLSAEVPCLILQPLAENAIKHGVDTLTTTGFLNVRAWRDNGQLFLSVRDNGPGMQPLIRTGSEKGIGLQNTAIRLQRLYGESQRLEILGVEPTGTLIRISFPFKDFKSIPKSQDDISDE